MSANDIGTAREPRHGIDHLVERVRAGRVQEALVRRAALRMTLDPDGVDHWGTFFGVGVIYRGTLLTHRIFPKGRSQGVFGSTMVTAGLIAKALTGRAPETLAEEDDPLTLDPMSIVLDGEPPVRGDYQLMLATTLHRLIAGIRPFWGRGPGGIRFTTLKQGCLNRPRDLANVLRGRAPKGSSVPGAIFSSRNVEKLEVTLDCGITLDGEMFPPRPGRHAVLAADHRVRFLATR
jgi:hypothetical protein